MMKNILLQLHLYAGLAIAGYLVVFGVSSLNFNHHFGWMEPVNSETQWEKTIQIPSIEDPRAQTEAIRDSLKLFGWPPIWRFHRAGDTINFQIVRMGKEYNLTAFQPSGRVEVQEITRGFWPTFNSLHFLGGNIPGNTPWLIQSWRHYQNLSVFVILFSIVTGIYLWSFKRAERRIGWWLIGSVSGFSLLLMFYLWLVG